MSDLISRQAAIDAINRIQSIISHNKKKIIFRAEAADVIKSLPSAQPMRKNGKWLPYKYAKPGYEYKFHVCSACGCCDEYVSDVPRTNGTIGRLESVRNFCPTCGADMRGEKENENNIQ